MWLTCVPVNRGGCTSTVLYVPHHQLPASPGSVTELTAIILWTETKAFVDS